jgi:hypothetical protein
MRKMENKSYWILLSFFLSLVMAGCAGDNMVSTQNRATNASNQTTSASVDLESPPTCDGCTTGSVYGLTDFSGGTLTAVNSKGEPVSITFSNDTIFREANLDRYSPVDPCRDVAEIYNTTPSSSLDTKIGVLSGCKARIWLQKSAPTDPCRAFRPVS